MRSPHQQRVYDFLGIAGEVLVASGWKPLVIGGIEVHKYPFGGPHSYQLVIPFTGGKLAVNLAEPSKK